MSRIVFIFSFLGTFMGAQKSFSQDYFNLRYGHDSLQEIGKTILTVDSGYYIVNYRYVDWNNSKVNLTYLDSTGNIKWQKSYGQSGIWYSGGKTGKQLVLSHDKKKMYFACTGIDSLNRYFGVLWSFNREGDSLFCKYYGDSLTFYSNDYCQITLDSCIIIAGAMNNGTTQAMLIKTDSLGNKLWEQIFWGGGTEYGCSVLQKPDGGFLVGITTTSYGGDADMALLSTDAAGNEQWLQPYTGNFDEALSSYIISLSDGNYALCGGLGSSTMNYGWPRVIKINPAGNVIWDKKYGADLFGSMATGIVETSDGNIIVTGTVNSKGIIFKINQNGDSLWCRNLQHTSISSLLSTNVLWAIDTAINGGYVCAGVMYPSSPDTGSVDVWVIKVDEWGCDTLGCQFVSVEENEMEKAIVKIFPNPTSDYLYIEMDDDIFDSGIITFSIYDIIGKKILFTQARSKWESIDISRFANGTYIILVEKNSITIGKSKFVKE